MGKYSRTLLLFSFYPLFIGDLGLGFYSNHGLDYIIPTLCVHVVLPRCLITSCGKVTVAMEINLGTHFVDNGVFHMWILLLKNHEVML